MNKRVVLKFVSVMALVLYLIGFAWFGVGKIEEFGAQSRFVGAVERLSLRIHEGLDFSEKKSVSQAVRRLLTKAGYEKEDFGILSSNVVATESFNLLEFDQQLANNDLRAAKAMLVAVSVRVREEHNKKQSTLQILFIVGLIGCYGMASLVAFFFGKTKVVEHRLDGRAVELEEILPSSPLGVAIQNVCNVESVKSGHDYVLELKGDGLISVTDAHYPLIEACICELAANAITHGGRATAVRESLEKPATIKVFVGVERSDEKWTVTVADDGEGIDELEVMRHAAAKQLLAADSIKNLQEGQGVRLILLDGFSNAALEKAGPLKFQSLAGVRRAVQQLEGSISLRNRPGVFCEFGLTIPFSTQENGDENA